jgi:hypothetical protein
MNTTKIARWLALGAGAMDFSTGLGLVALPTFTLGAMLVPAPAAPEALLFVRFVGAFVAATGALYLLAGLGSNTQLRVLLRATMAQRIAAGVFTGGAILLGALPVGWLAVTFTDLALVVAQIWLLQKGAGTDE